MILDRLIARNLVNVDFPYLHKQMTDLENLVLIGVFQLEGDKNQFFLSDDRSYHPFCNADNRKEYAKA